MIAFCVTSVSLLERFGEKMRNVILADGLRKRDTGTVSGDLIMLDALRSSDDDQIEDRTLFVVLLDLVLGFLDKPAHCFADLAPRPHAHLLHRLLNALDLHLRLLNVHRYALAQRFGARLAQGLLHAAECLFFSAVGILQFFGQ
jgi:hypothetical protein